MYNLWNSAFDGVRAVFHFIVMQRINNIRVINAQKARNIHHKKHQNDVIYNAPIWLKNVHLQPQLKESYQSTALLLHTLLALYDVEQCMNTKIEEGSY